MKKSSLFAITLLGALLVWQPTADAQFNPLGREVELSCDRVRLIQKRLLRAHIMHDELTDEIGERMVKVYSEALDPTKVLMTQKDHDALKKTIATMNGAKDKELCKTLGELRVKELEWRKGAEDYAKKRLASKSFKVDPKTTITIDPDDRAYPKNQKELDALRDDMLQLQMANYLANGTKEAEAKEKLLRRYARETARADKLTEADQVSVYLNAFASSLDPHTTYFSPDALEDFRISMRLSLEGIGASLTWRDGYTIVREVIPGGAADRHGKLRTEDKIIAVAQDKDEPVDVIDMDLRDVVKLIRGKRGTKVRLTVLRQGEKTERMELTIVRDKIDLGEQAAKLRWEEVERNGDKLKIAVIDLPSFYGGRGPGARSCVRDMKKLLKEAEVAGADGLVLDLSRNGGGLLDAAVDISGMFLGEGAVVGVKGRGGDVEVLKDRDSRVLYSGPMVVLTSSLSASASEILVGALKDYGRAVIVGDAQTYGKGTVQQVSNLPMGLGAIKTTTATFYLPGGVSTQANGVASDIVLPSVLAALDISEKEQPYALPPVKVDAFKGAKANPKVGGYEPVTKSTVAKLEAKTKKRVSKSEEFKEVSEEIAKVSKKEKSIKLSSILEESKDPESKGDDEPLADKDEPTPQVKEATQIVADLVDLQRAPTAKR